MTEVLTYEALKADRDAQQKRADALAVENGVIKLAFKNLSNTVEEAELYGDMKYLAEPSEYEALADAIEETPATDAALDAVRAQERADLISVFNQQIKNTGLDDEALVTVLECREALKHAVELREGK